MRQGETGTALLSVLLLVAVIAAMTVGVLDRMNMTTRVVANMRGVTQARYYAQGAEAFAASQISRLLARDPGRTTLAGGWNGRTYRFPTDQGMIQATLRDGGNCFNLNSVAQGSAATALISRGRGIEQFVALAKMEGVAEADARHIAAALADWVDSDAGANQDGAEDAVYQRATPAYLPANTMLAETSELRAVDGVTNEIYAALRPWLCALPTTDLSPVNINTLAPDQAPLLAMLLPDRLTETQARQLIEQRPPDGWGDLTEFWQHPMLADLAPPSDVLMQPQLTTKWFTLDIMAENGGFEARESALLAARTGQVRVVARRWTGDE